ncbi:MAG: sigma-70 family RNA polymerase sigma factor [Planctomycetota bacterium]
MALSDFDRNLVERCLAGKPQAWENFVDRFTGLVLHVINHTAQSRSTLLSAPDRDDLAGEVMLAIVQNDYAALRNFRGKSSLATYLTVIARRVVVRKLVGTQQPTPLSEIAESVAPGDEVQRVTDRDEVARMLDRLDPRESDVVRLYHLEGKTYQEISSATGIPANSIGPTLSRARAHLRDVNQPNA